MRFNLGLGTKDWKSALTRWGAEIRKAYLLTDEDFEWKDWSFSLADITTGLVGVTFSSLNIKRARYLHIGKRVDWELYFTIQASADFTDISIPPVPVQHDFDEVSLQRVLKVYGRVSPCRLVALGAFDVKLQPVLLGIGDAVPALRIAPELHGLSYFYTTLGTVPTTFSIGGSYPAKDFPGR